MRVKLAQIRLRVNRQIYSQLVYKHYINRPRWDKELGEVRCLVAVCLGYGRVEYNGAREVGNTKRPPRLVKAAGGVTK